MAKVKALRNFFFEIDQDGKRVNFKKGETYTVSEAKLKTIEANSVELVKDEKKEENKK